MMIGLATRTVVNGNYSIYQYGWMLSLPLTVICDGRKVALSELIQLILAHMSRVSSFLLSLVNFLATRAAVTAGENWGWMNKSLILMMTVIHNNIPGIETSKLININKFLNIAWIRYIHVGRDPFNQNFPKLRSKTEWIGLVQQEKFQKISLPFEVDLFFRLDWSDSNGPFHLTIPTHSQSQDLVVRYLPCTNWRKLLITALLWIVNSRSIGVTHTYRTDSVYVQLPQVCPFCWLRSFHWNRTYNEIFLKLCRLIVYIIGT